MEFALSIALIIGIILFALGFFIVVWAGFKHHFVTGLIGLIPALNFIILPSVWHRAYIGFYLSIIGALITLGAWYGGGEQYMVSQAAKFGITLPISTTTEERDEISSVVTQANEENTLENTQQQPEAEKIKVVEVVDEESFIPSGDLHSLPQQALYFLVFETVDIGNISSLKGKYVRIEQKDGNVIEGKVTKASHNGLFIGHDANSGSVAFEIKTDTISKLEKLVKRNN